MTCGSDCTGKIYSEAGQKGEPIGLPEGYLSVSDAAKAVQVSTMTLSNWRCAAKVSAAKYGGRFIYNLEKLKQEIAAKGLTYKPRTATTADVLMVASDIVSPPISLKPGAVNYVQPPEPQVHFNLDEIRTEMQKAAKEAARDVVLVYADRARDKGEHEIRAQLLEDFIQMDEGLTMCFKERV